MRSPHPSRRRAWIWLALLLTPPLLLLGSTAWITFVGGEIYDSREIAVLQSRGETEILFGPAYSNPEVSFKQSRIVRDAPEVLVLGSSRVLPFRKEFFKEGTTFYNGGRIAPDIWILRQCLERLPKECLPKLLIVGLDQYNFNAAESNYHPDAISWNMIEAHFAEKEEGWNRFQGIWPSVLGDVIRGKIPFTGKQSHGFAAYGMSARLHGSGFRNDGSYRYGKVLAFPPEARDHTARMEETLRRISRGSSRFRPGDTVNPECVREVELLARWCEKRKIPVVAFLPPYAPSALVAMESSLPPYSYLEKLPELLAPLFHAEQQTFFDFTRIPDASDAEFTDGFHGGEQIYAKMLLIASERSSPLEAFIDRQRLEVLISGAIDPLEPID